MTKTFEYLYSITAQDNISVEDIGNCCIKVFNDLGYYWYLLIETDLGTSYIKMFGPFNSDIPKFIHGFNFNYTSFDYNEKKLCGIIDKFINDPKKDISQVFEVDFEEAYNDMLKLNLKNIK